LGSRSSLHCHDTSDRACCQEYYSQSQSPPAQILVYGLEDIVRATPTPNTHTSYSRQKFEQLILALPPVLSTVITGESSQVFLNRLISVVSVVVVCFGTCS